MIIRTVTYKRADTSIPFWQPSQSQQQHLDYINNGKMISFDSATPDQYTQIKTIKFIDRAAMEEYMSDPDIMQKHAERDAYHQIHGITRDHDDIEEEV